MFNRSRNAGAQTKTIMEKNVNEILMLRYQIKRYQAMRKGAMCQALNSRMWQNRSLSRPDAGNSRRTARREI